MPGTLIEAESRDSDSGTLESTSHERVKYRIMESFIILPGLAAISLDQDPGFRWISETLAGKTRI